MAYVRQHPDYPLFRMQVGVMPDFSGSNYSDQEIPAGQMNGVNRLFTLKYTPLPNSESLHKDGMMMARASSLAFTDGDYFINNLVTPATITFSNKQIPQVKSVIRISYKFIQVP